jgi:prepilin-type N-terminal cleavage/methylation domain-containing protein
MRSTWSKPASSPRGHRARGFTLSEMMLTVAIMVAVLVVTVPSFTAISRDLELSKARSDVFAALTAARSRAITSHNMVALHIFRDTGNVYTVPRDSGISTAVGYNQSTLVNNSYRWGVNFDPATGRPAYGLPHIPTNKMTMRLEVPNPDSTHNLAATDPTALEFFWPADHDPIVLPESLGICRPQTPLD